MGANWLRLCSNVARFPSNQWTFRIEGVPEEQMMRLRQRAKAIHRSLQGELRALIDEATGAAPHRLSIDEIAERVGKLGLTRRDEAARLIRADRDR
jgi:hypothetical protein